MEALTIRAARKDDIDEITELVVRTKKLNNEFDPLFAIVDRLVPTVREYVEDSIRSSGVLLLAGVKGRKVVGVLRAELRQRRFYNPEREGRITDFYILPEFRRKAFGNRMLEKAIEELRRMGADIITAEVPSQNEIAVRFYNKRGFRSLVQIFAKPQ